MTAVVAALVVGYVSVAPASANPGDPPGVLTVGGLQRTYLVHAPAGGAPTGLVLNLHGSGMTGGDQAGLTDYNAVADQYGEQDPVVVAGELAVAADLLARAFATVRPDEWGRTGFRSDGAAFTIESFTRYMVHDPVHHVRDVRVGYAALDG